MDYAFNIIGHLSGLTGFTFDKDVLVRVARKNGVLGITSEEELDELTEKACERDLLMTIVNGPWSTASHTNKHGNFSVTIGSQTITSDVMDNIIARIKRLNKALGEEDASEDLPTYGSDMVAHTMNEMNSLDW